MHYEYENWEKINEFCKTLADKHIDIIKLKDTNLILKAALIFAFTGLFITGFNSVNDIEKAIETNDKQKIEIERLKNKLDSIQTTQYKTKGK